jgi:hypothetical protein
MRDSRGSALGCAGVGAAVASTQIEVLLQRILLFLLRFVPGFESAHDACLEVG